MQEESWETRMGGTMYAVEFPFTDAAAWIGCGGSAALESYTLMV